MLSLSGQLEVLAFQNVIGELYDLIPATLEILKSTWAPGHAHRSHQKHNIKSTDVYDPFIVAQHDNREEVDLVFVAASTFLGFQCDLPSTNSA